jgi:hypothetical protein
MRRAIFWFGWAVLLALPVIYTIQIIVAQDLPPIETWKWIVPVIAVLIIIAARNRDDVLKHHVA